MFTAMQGFKKKSCFTLYVSVFSKCHNLLTLCFVVISYYQVMFIHNLVEIEISNSILHLHVCFSALLLFHTVLECCYSYM